MIKFSGLTRGRTLAACGVIALATGTVCAQTSAKRFAITDGSVLAAMQRKQVSLHGVQLRITSPMTSSVAEPELEVRTLIMADKHTAQLLVGCRNAAECLPFYASATWPAGVEVTEIRPGAAHRDDVSREPANHTSSGDASSLHAGSPATLLLDGARVHVMLRVVCMESGGPGERVRVTTLDRRQEYIADVIAPGLLKGAF